MEPLANAVDISAEAHTTPATRARGDVPGGQDLHTLVESNLNFVASIAGEFRHRGVPFEDLVHEGTLGLILAAQRFDPSRGVKFITYAVWWVRKTILKSIADHGSLVRVPEYQMKRLREARDTERRIEAEGPKGAAASGRARESHSGTSLDRVKLLLQREVRLDESIGDDDSLLLGGMLRDDLPSPEEACLKSEALRLIAAAIDGLTARERRVLALRYGFGGERALSLSDTGEALGLSGERVRQIEAGALARMRRSMLPARRGQAPLRRQRVAIRLG